MSDIAIDKIRELMKHPPIKWLKDAGQKFELLEERHVRINVQKDLHLNHVDTIYAGSIFTFAELAGAALLFATYGMKEWIPILRGASIHYASPCTTDLVFDLQLTAEEAAEKIQPVLARGRGDLFLSVPVQDTKGNVIADAEFNYYMIPYNDNMRL